MPRHVGSRNLSDRQRKPFRVNALRPYGLGPFDENNAQNPRTGFTEEWKRQVCSVYELTLVRRLVNLQYTVFAFSGMVQRPLLDDPNGYTNLF